MNDKNNFQPKIPGGQTPQRQNTQTVNSQQAAINFRRQKIDEIYSGKTNYITPQTNPIAITQKEAAPSNNTQEKPSNIDQAPILKKPQRTITPLPKESVSANYGAIKYQPKQAKNPYPLDAGNASEQWKRYHTAWQNYYQKYYQSYYDAALNQHKKAVANIHPEVVEELTEEQKRQRALAKLKEDISKKARERTVKIRKSRHLIPIITGIAVVMLFAFLQYNRLILASVEAYVSPGNATAEEIIQTPNQTVAISSDPKLIIPKINVSVPINYGFANDHASQMKAMENGVAHFSIPGANSVPGQLGNTVIAGHSSNDVFDNGQYKFIFAQLEKMAKGDVIYVNHEGVRYSYIIRETEVVLPNQVSKIVKNDGKAWLTLITCVPLGTAEKRLLVFAEQVSPDPSNNKAADSGSQISSSEVELPRNSKTIFERIFSWDWS